MMQYHRTEVGLELCGSPSPPLLKMAATAAQRLLHTNRCIRNRHTPCSSSSTHVHVQADEESAYSLTRELPPSSPLQAHLLPCPQPSPLRALT